MSSDHFPQPNIIPICLPDNDNRLVGQVGTVTGWGRLSEYGQISPVLREAKLPIISNSKCMSMYRFENAKLLKSTMSKLPGILVRTSGFRISLSVREQAQEAKTAVRETVVVLWWSRLVNKDGWISHGGMDGSDKEECHLIMKEHGFLTISESSQEELKAM